MGTVDVSGKDKIGSDEEEEIQMLLSEIPRVTSPQQNQYHFLQRNGGFSVPTTLPPHGGGSGGYGNIGGTPPHLGRRSTQSLLSQASPSMAGTPSGVASPAGENDPLMEEFGLIARLGDVHFWNDIVAPEATRNGLASPFDRAVGSLVGDSSAGLSDYLDPQLSYGFSNHYHYPIAANSIASSPSCSSPSSSSSSSSSSSQYFSAGAGHSGGFYCGNRFPDVRGNSQVYAFDSDKGNIYPPSSTPAMPYRDLNPAAIAVAGQHHKLQVGKASSNADVNVFAREDNFIIQGKDLHLSQSRVGRGLRRERFIVDELRCPVRHPSSMFRTFKYDSLMDLRGRIYSVAKDQQGCRFLQQKFDERKPEDVEMILLELIGHAGELMVDPFANYLMQKLFDVCTEEQRLTIIVELTQRPFDLVDISKDNHGTRAVQRLLETLHTQPQIDMIVSALQPGFLELINDLNGHHVIQRCLQFLDPEDNKFIFEAAAKNCVKIATDQHGCCAFQRCIVSSSGVYQLDLIMQVALHGKKLASDRYGNYVVQFIMDMKVPLANKHLMEKLRGHFVELSMDKYGSNVVEKCLKLWEDAREIIILELLATPHFDMLLQHQYANYVIQRALSFKGPLRDALVDAIQPHAPVLRTSPYCKKIFSKPYFKRCTSY